MELTLDNFVFNRFEKLGDDHQWTKRHRFNKADFSFDVEFSILKLFEHEAIPKVIDKSPGELVMSFPEVRALIPAEGRTFEIDEFLNISLRLCDILEHMHDKDVIFLGLRPANLAIDEHGKIILLDFSQARYGRMQSSQSGLSISETSNLSYIAPEQSGRMNLGLDHRSDIYQLGLLFYRMLTGYDAFRADRTGQLIYQHISQLPEDPKRFRQEIPDALSEIILRMLAKSPLDRYYQVSSISKDLRQIHMAWKGEIQWKSLDLTKNEFGQRFELSHKIYGRDSELRDIQNFLDSRDRENHLIMISGHSGIGKSRLVESIELHNLSRNHVFLAGKNGEFDRATPYHALLMALNKWVQRILRSPEDELQSWRKKLEDALLDNLSLLTDVLPDLTYIIGPQAEIEPLPPVEASNRFNRTLQKFVDLLSTSVDKLVIFLDDMQWSDLATIQLIKRLYAEGSRVTFMLAYRDNEIRSDHPFQNFLLNLETLDTRYLSIRLQGLRDNDIIGLVADSLRLQLEDSRELGQLIFKLSDGVPLIAHQFLSTLYEKDLLLKEEDGPSWNYDIEQIRREDVYGDAVEFILSRIKTLGIAPSRLLGVCGCLGRTFRLSTLSKVFSEKEPEYLHHLRELTDHGFIAPLSTDFQLLFLEGTDTDLHNIEFKFAHDKIFESAQKLLSEGQKKDLKLAAIAIMIEARKERSDRSSVFDMVNLLDEIPVNALSDNLLVDLISVYEEAAYRAKKSIANEQAVKIFEKLFQMLKRAPSPDADLRQLYLDAGECAFLLGKIELPQLWIEKAFDLSDSPLEKAQVLRIKNIMYNYQSDLHMAGKAGLEALSYLGINIKENPSQWDVLKMLARVQFKLKRDPLEQIRNLEKSEKKEVALATDIMLQMLSTVFNVSPSFLGLILLNSFYLTLKNGLSPAAPAGISGYGFLIGVGFKRIERGWEYIELGSNLEMASENKIWQSRGKFGYAGNYIHYIKDLREAVPILRESYDLGLEVGAFTNSGFASMGYVDVLLFASYPIPFIKSEAEEFLAFMRSVNITDMILCHTGVLHNCQLLTSQDTSSDLSAFENEMSNSQFVFIRMSYWVSRMRTYYILGRWNEGLIYMEKLEQAKPNLEPTPQQYEYYLFSALLKLRAKEASIRSLSGKEMRGINKKRRLFKKMADRNSANYGARYALLDAEIKISTGNTRGAIVSLEACARSARKKEQYFLEGLAYERLYELETQKSTGGSVLGENLELAIQAFSRVGYEQKIRDLEAQYGISLQSDGLNKGVALSEVIDLESIMETGRILSGERDLNQLIAKLVQISIENAGAHRGVLILLDEDKLMLRAMGNHQEVEIMENESLPLKSDLMPVNLINYSIRTYETVIVDESEKGMQEDEYFKESRARSAIVVPIMNKGEIFGAIYMENELSPNVFTREKKEILQLITTQAAISIENARQYEKLIKLNESYERFVPKEFLRLLKKRTIEEVNLGDSTESEMNVLFADIRNFTELSEQMGPKDNFEFINSYLSQMEPVIEKNNGFIDKYIGDAIMALFPGSADHALECAVQMSWRLKQYNSSTGKSIKVGIGINHGSCMLGTVGGTNRMEGTVISDTVNLAARVESWTKRYDSQLLVTAQFINALEEPDKFHFRQIDRTQARGKSEYTDVFEVLDVMDKEELDLRLSYMDDWKHLWDGSTDQSELKAHLERLLGINPNDSIAQYHFDRLTGSSETD
jgi:predicted ATPase/class 3 adenylate cyclase